MLVARFQLVEYVCNYSRSLGTAVTLSWRTNFDVLVCAMDLEMRRFKGRRDDGIEMDRGGHKIDVGRNVGRQVV